MTEPVLKELTLPPSWPVWAATAAYPLWWALGVTTIIYPLLALVLGYYLVQMRPIRIPPGGLVWAMFLVVVIISSVMLSVDAPGTAIQHGIGPYGAYALRLLTYLSLTFLLLYVGNHNEQAIPLRSVIAALACLSASVTVLGLAGALIGSFSFRTPGSYLLPSILSGDGKVSLAQVHNILGEAAPRPSAPFEYTNTWGEVISMTLIWLVVYALVVRTKRVQVATIVALSFIPILASLNRAVWLGMVLTLVYVAIRLAVRLRLAPVMGIVTIAVIGIAALAITPAGQLVETRIEAGHSDQIRANLASDAIRLAGESPILGYGSTRKTQGSYESIAIGPSPDCSQCGERVIGSTGHLWLLLVAQGWLGTTLYMGFFICSLWAYRSDHSPLGIAGSAVILLSLFYSYFYAAVGAPLAVTMLSIGLLWRNAQARQLACAEGPRAWPASGSEPTTAISKNDGDPASARSSEPIREPAR